MRKYALRLSFGSTAVKSGHLARVVDPEGFDVHDAGYGRGVNRLGSSCDDIGC